MANNLSIANLSTDQHTAIELCVDPTIRIASVTGEGGTGKTTVLGETAGAIENAGFTLKLCAPTGRAAARIREATGRMAATCHRLLGYGMPDPNDPDDYSFPERSRSNPIPAEFILVDESSMLSEELYRNLINSLQKGACIRFFGDINQLPPINTDYSPFQRLLDKFPKVILAHNYRSGDGIVQAAQTIIRGRLPKVNAQFSMINIPGQMSLSVLDKFIDTDMFDPRKSQIITPTRVGKIGSQVVNAYVQQKLNDSPRVLELGYTLTDGVRQEIRLRPNDKILWTKNDYNLNLFNGMIGRVRDFDDVDGGIVAEFEGKDYMIPSILEQYDDLDRKTVSYDPRKYIDLAYAITTHKSQGSEFDRVLIMLYWSSVMSRQNFYTAVTRGRKQVTVLAGPGGLKAALKSDPIFKN